MANKELQQDRELNDVVSHLTILYAVGDRVLVRANLQDRSYDPEIVALRDAMAAVRRRFPSVAISLAEKARAAESDMTLDEIARDRTVIEAAEPGPWYANEEGEVNNKHGMLLLTTDSLPGEPEDAEFCAVARH